MKGAAKPSARKNGEQRAQAAVACARCPLRRLDCFDAYANDRIDFIQSLKIGELHVDTDAEIIPEGAHGGHLYTLLSGWAFRFKTLSDGRRQILNFLLPGDFIGLQQKMSADATHGVRALSEVRLCVFPRDSLWEIHRTYPDLAYDVTWLAAHEEALVDETLLSVGRRNAAERIALLLLLLHQRASSLQLGDDSGAVPFPITQQHIADALGLSLVHTNKTLRRLEATGLHRIRGGRLSLPNPAALASLADHYGRTATITRPLI